MPADVSATIVRASNLSMSSCWGFECQRCCKKLLWRMMSADQAVILLSMPGHVLQDRQMASA